MNNRFWMAFAAVYVSFHLLGFLLHGVMLADTYKALAAVWRPEAEMQAKMWVMFANSAVYLFLFCYIFTRGYENKGIMEGLRYGGLMGLFVSIMTAYDSYVIYPVPYSLVLTWFVSGVVIYVVLGAVLASIYKRA